jgi:hypothetical protein
MAKRGRPRAETPRTIVRVKLYLVPGEDDDLIQWFEGIPDRLRARYVMAALRGAGLELEIGEDLPSDDEVADLLGDRLW